MPPDIVFRPPPHLIDAHFALIEGLIHAGILEPPVVPLRRCILNHYFLLLKTNGVVRLIFNGMRVNRCLPRPPPFSMTNISHISSDIAQQEHTHASELDLFSAFYQIPVYPSFRRFLCIATPTHGVLQCTRLPMGMYDKMRLPFSAGDVLGIFFDLKHRCPLYTYTLCGGECRALQAHPT